MQINGVELDGLCHSAQAVTFPDVVPGRHVHIDADFLAYQVSAEKIDEEKSISDMKGNADVAIETLRMLAGAETAVLHLTPKGSTKGDRYDLAMIKEYQANRKGKEKPRYLHLIREWMSKERGAILHMTIEADDGMAMAQYAAIAKGERHLSIIASKDKDLRMVPGLQLNWDTGEIHETETDFGYIYLDDTKSSKQVKGFGHAFFWAQMLMGDTADNISGIPMIGGNTLNRIQPTQAITKAFEVIDNKDATEKQCLAALKKLDGRKSKTCGPVLTYDILRNVKSNKDAFTIVRHLYQEIANEVHFTNWRTGEPIGFGEALLSEGYLLWMRREESHLDFYNWLQEIVDDHTN